MRLTRQDLTEAAGSSSAAADSSRSGSSNDSHDTTRSRTRKCRSSTFWWLCEAGPRTPWAPCCKSTISRLWRSSQDCMRRRRSRGRRCLPLLEAIVIVLTRRRRSVSI